jgi:hypothetical protein
MAYREKRRMGERNLNRRLLPTATPQDYEDRLGRVLCPLDGFAASVGAFAAGGARGAEQKEGSMISILVCSFFRACVIHM